eukprot:CAMPEP_0177187966 /NCGR_PEP_ID=MMETSP0367-20130122/19478_1 /TAXON_ID=447022 ORGANISM="Scrippsiella hangoei-like, Strain SHHI-4" /NCGR_SAMPLE_ID=MMETSP0367 /ASSEMBLY_ACC=CAM_ASM_000362 /LENGTH=50 /DNA_ID=CAMNT_0018635395 /DNA_START=144 /DNA_END=293 /DNA_ORIENTATION=-
MALQDLLEFLASREYFTMAAGRCNGGRCKGGCFGALLISDQLGLSQNGYG